jgi:hypothetical protein
LTPAAVHRLPVQHPPSHTPPGQQSWFGPPHGCSTHEKPLQVPASGAHVPPGQHCWLSPPHAPQVVPLLPLHATPASKHTPPGQQRWPGPPQVWQVLEVPLPHTPESQAPPTQQVLPKAPQLRHMPPWHDSLSLSQRLLVQQGSPLPPQSTQVLRPVQTLSMSHGELVARHTFAAGLRTSQQPELHRSPAQHGWLGPPQPAQLPVGKHRSPVLHVEPVARQRFAPSQQPELHTRPAQQTVPGVPQAVQVKPEQVVAGCEQ